MYPHSWSAHMPPSCSIVGLETAPARKSSLLLTGSHGRTFENCHETLFKKSNKQKPHQKANERSQLLNSLIKDKVKRHCITSFSWSHQISVQANVGCTGSQSLNIRTALFSLGVFPISLELKIPQLCPRLFCEMFFPFSKIFGKVLVQYFTIYLQVWILIYIMYEGKNRIIQFLQLKKN